MSKKWFRAMFGLDRRERWGLAFLIGLLLGLLGITSLLPPRPLIRELPPVYAEKGRQNTDFEKETTNNEIGWVPSPFDPNQTSENEWVKMGVSARTAKTIQNYLAKGGSFRRPEDLQKIWGMKPADCNRLMPYVRIPDRPRRSAEREDFNVPLSAKLRLSGATPQRKSRTAVDINLADSVVWESLPGIGPGYARRITRFRERLGGFVHPDQVRETYQLPDSVFQKLRPYLADASERMVRQLNVNTAAIDSLGRHPYCGYSKARLIVRYREQHGSFERMEDLLDIQTLDSVWLERIRPYLKLQ